MLVDDEPMILEGMKDLIQWDELGLEVGAVATNGAEALEKLAETACSILVTDIRMPEMDGLELLRRIRTEKPDMRAIVLSGHDDFPYVKEAARLGIENYLLKPVNEEELVSTLLLTTERLDRDARERLQSRQDSSLIRENLLLRWVTGTIDMNELALRREVLGLPETENRFTVAILQGATAMAARDADPFQHALMEAFRTTRPACGMHVFRNLQGDLVLLFREADGHRATPLPVRLEACIRALQASTGLRVTALVGRTLEGIEQVPASYRDALQLKDYVGMGSSGPVVSHGEMQENLDRINSDIHIDYVQLRKLVLAMDAGGLARFSDRLFQKLAEDANPCPPRIRTLTMHIGLYIMSTASIVRSTVQLLCDEMDRLFAEVWDNRTLEDLNRWIKRVAETTVTLMKKGEKGYSATINQVLQHIETNYQKDLSLKVIAHSLNMNATYLGQLFKNETGQMFSAYVNEVRVEKAKELLVSTKLNAAEIGMRVGYASSNHFFIVFRKVTGSSPSEYRRLGL